MDHKIFEIKTEVWLYKGPAAWHFVTIDEKTSREIKRFETFPRRGFGSIPVKVIIGETAWNTSVFPEKKGTYILPIKKSVRNAEGIESGDNIELRIEVAL